MGRGKMVWKLITLKNYPLFSRLWIHQAFLYDMKDTIGMNFTMYKSLYNGTYVDFEEFEGLKHFLVNKLENNPDSILEICRNWENDCNLLLEHTKNLSKLILAFLN